MKRLISRLKLNNKGMSLVEILVTVAIIALIASPIIDSFLNAMQVNSKARLIQNGTAVAQDTAELFKVFDVETLVASYEGEDGVTVSCDDNGVYTFEGIAIEGADGEKFVVDVELDPSSYKANVENEKIDVNDVELPVFSGLYGSDSIMLYRQYAGPDEQLAELFTGKLDSDILTNIHTTDVRKKIKKSTVVNIVCDYNDSTDKYEYTVNVVITYTYDNTTPVTVTKTIEKTYDENEIHNVYMLCPIFDRYSTEMGSGYYYSTDEIRINYTYDEAGGEPNPKHDMYFYIAEQNMNNIGYDETIQERIKPSNIYINGEVYTEYIEKYASATPPSLKVYTNIGDNEYGLTYGDYNTGTALYEMNVTVKLEGSEDTVTTFTTSK